MPALFVAGAGTDVGKTFVTAGLIRALRARGIRTEALKPVVSGFDPADWSASDPAQLLEALGQALSLVALEAMSPWRYAAPLAPDLAARMEGRSVDFAAVTARCRARIATAGDAMLVIEGVGGVMSPLSDDRTGLDLMTALGTPAVLVGGSYLGGISHTLTALAVLRDRGVDVAAIVLSDSGKDAPLLGETAASLRRFSASTPVIELPRGGDLAVFDRLAALVGG